MTAPSSPSSRVAEAARVLRERAEKARGELSGEWVYRPDHEVHGGRFGPVSAPLTADGPPRGGAVPWVCTEVGEWIATADPSVGLLLADLLERHVPVLIDLERVHGDNVERALEGRPAVRSVLALSDALLAKGGEQR